MLHTSTALRILLDLIRLVVFGVGSYQNRCHEGQKTCAAEAGQILQGTKPTVTWGVWRWSQEAWVQSHGSSHQICGGQSDTGRGSPSNCVSLALY
jgi:hypothetical protein